MSHDDLLNRLGQLESETSLSQGECLSDSQVQHYRQHSYSEAEKQGIEAHACECELCADRLFANDGSMPKLSETAMRRIMSETASPKKAMSPLWVPGLLTACAALALFLVLPSFDREVIALAPYSASLEGDMKQVRGNHDQSNSGSELPILIPQSVLTLKAAPDRGIPKVAPESQAYLVLGDGQLQAIATPVTRLWDANSGLLTLQYETHGILAQNYGRHTVVLLVLPTGIEPPKSLDTTSWPAGSQHFEFEFLYQQRPDKINP